MDPANPAARPRRRRTALVAAAVAVALTVGGAIAHRILRPAEIITTGPAAAGYPTPAQARPGVIGTLAAAPLIVQGRLRVYATTRQIRADAPVDARTQRSPFWSYRRWPEQVTGVVAAGATVVGRWSDGRLVAIDARTGEVAWRAAGPTPETGAYDGGRTGAATAYAPDGLYTAGTVVIARSATQAIGVDLADGRVLWRLPSTGRECRLGEFTTAGGRFATVNGCADRRPEVRLYDVATGRLATAWRAPDASPGPGTDPSPGVDALPGPGAQAASVRPLGCRVGRSECAGMRLGEGGGWLLRGAEPVRAPGLDPTDAWLTEAPGVGDVAVSPERDGRLVGRPAVGGEPLWSWLPGAATPGGQGSVIAVQPGRVHLLTGGRFLVTVDPATGVELSRFHFTYGREHPRYVVGHAYAAAGFILVERLTPGAAPSDDRYYLTVQPVLLAAA